MILEFRSRSPRAVFTCPDAGAPTVAQARYVGPALIPQTQQHHQLTPKHTKPPEFRSSGMNIDPESAPLNPTPTCGSLPWFGSGMLEPPPCWHPSMKCQGMHRFGHQEQLTAASLQEFSGILLGTAHEAHQAAFGLQVCAVPETAGSSKIKSANLEPCDIALPRGATP